MKRLSSILLVCSLIMIGTTQKSQAQCLTGYSQIIVNIIPDDYPNETSWDVKDATNTVIASGNTNSDTFCYPTGSLLHLPFMIHMVMAIVAGMELVPTVFMSMVI